MRNYISLMAGILLLISIDNASATLNSNGDFETGNFSGWFLDFGAVAVTPESAFLGNPWAAGTFPSGDYAANFGGGDDPAGDGFLVLHIDTIIGQKYELSFDYGNFIDPAINTSQSLNVNIYGSSLILGLTITDSTGTGNLGELFSNYSIPFTANSTFADLTFGDSSSTSIGADGVLDNVTVNPIPEPTTMVLFGTGVAGLLGARFRRKKK